MEEGTTEIHLRSRERAVLAALLSNEGRVIDRDQLRREAGLADLSARRCEAALVSLRRALGPDAVVTVRRRGWRLNPEVVGVALALVSSLG